jgi:hypothetical protein
VDEPSLRDELLAAVRAKPLVAKVTASAPS